LWDKASGPDPPSSPAALLLVLCLSIIEVKVGKRIALGFAPGHVGKRISSHWGPSLAALLPQFSFYAGCLKTCPEIPSFHVLVGLSILLSLDEFQIRIFLACHKFLPWFSAFALLIMSEALGESRRIVDAREGTR
jgi:hypothetical protein